MDIVQDRVKQLVKPRANFIAKDVTIGNAMIRNVAHFKSIQGCTKVQPSLNYIKEVITRV